ncbi:MAG TPA: nucleotidyltransferase domain-containing protein, partial [Candidatus Rifleibacterium sp.]|nr:nucleotidyltransferase domain-containing protein [Candidatus Rifleibacterium sp.]
KEARSFHGLSLDAWFYPTESMNPDNDEFLRLHDGCCLQDMDGTGRAFLNRLHEKFLKGPAPVTEEERRHSTEWVRKMLQRASGSSIEALYRRSWLAVEILMIYFQLRNQWYCGPKKSFGWLEKNDPQALRLFQAVYQDPENMPALHALAEHVIATGKQNSDEN